MKIEEILTEHSRLAGVPPLKLNNEGICRLEVNDKYAVALEKAPDGFGFYIYTVVGRVSDYQKLHIFEEALDANLFGRGTGKATLGFSPETQCLVLFQFIQEDGMDFPVYSRHLEAFLGRTDYWIEQLDKGDFKGAPEEGLTIKQLWKQPVDSKGMKIFFA